jgi:hypothetical protein
MTIKPPQTQVLATPKKAKKTARSKKRPRDRDWEDAYAWRPQRAETWEPRGYGSHFWRPW